MGLKIETYENNVLLSTVDDRELADVIAIKRELINVLRNEKKDAGITVNGIKWDSDQQSRDNVTGAVTGIAAGVPFPEVFYWRDYENVDQPVNAAFLVALGGALIMYMNQVYGVSWYHKNNISALTTNDEVDDYDIATNWPSTNMDPP